MSAAFILSNLAIALGYLYIAFALVPILPIRRITLVGGVGFFLLCAGTHVDLMLHALFTPEETMGEMVRSVHMQLIHIPQALAIWVFAVGFVSDMRSLARERRTTRPANA